MRDRMWMVVAAVGIVAWAATSVAAPSGDEGRDARVRGFLDAREGTWRDMNVPAEDGQVLHDLIVSRGFTRGLEIGTSTGRSTIWIAWAMSKTGGKVVTIEIDPDRHREALSNLEAAGLSAYVDARLADAHELVPALPGPFDFVFSDADKGWYTQYFKDVEQKLAPAACFTAHNVRNGFRGVDELLDYVRARPGFTTRIEGSRASGVSISCRTAPGR